MNTMNAFFLCGILVSANFIEICSARRLSTSQGQAKNQNPKGYSSSNVAFYNSSNTWVQCHTKDVTCGDGRRGVVCDVGDPAGLASAKVEYLDPVFKEFKTFVSGAEKALEIVKNLAKESKTARDGLKKLKKMIDDADKEETIEAGNGDVDPKWISGVRGHIQKLHENIVAAVVQLQGVRTQCQEKRDSDISSLRHGKTKIIGLLAAKIATWKSKESNLVVGLSEGIEGFQKMEDYYKPMQDALHSLYWKVVEFKNALEPATKMKTSEYREMVKLLLPIFVKNGFFSSTPGIVEELEQYEDDWNRARRESNAGLKEQERRSLGEFTPFGSFPEGPFRFYEVNKAIPQDFLDNQLPQAFLGMAPCLECQGNSNMAKVPDLQLAHHRGVGKDSKPFVCMKAASKCLKDKAVCGCYASDASLMTREQASENILEDTHTHFGCTHMLFKDASPSPTNIGVSSLAPTFTCSARDEVIRKEFKIKFEKVYGVERDIAKPLRVCMVTWNVGSERAVPLSGAGVGWGGVEGAELLHDLEEILDECSNVDNSIVALTFQEGSDSSIVSKLEMVVQKKYGAGWKVQANAYAGGNDNMKRNKTYKGYEDKDEIIDWMHELPHLQTPFTQGVHLAIITRTSIDPEIRTFGLDFKGKSAVASFKNWARSLAGSTGDKGTAIAQLRFRHGGHERTICFAGSHLDASSESKRSVQTGKTMDALKRIGCPDGVWWGGDFNPRLDDKKQCCPWDRLELLMHHGQKNALIDVIKKMDPISQGFSWRKNVDEDTMLTAPFTMDDWQCQGRQCSAGWHEFPIGFAPTFHKLYDREGRNTEEGTCRFEPQTVPKVSLNDDQGPAKSDRLGEVLQKVNDENSARIKSWKSEGTCHASGKDKMCWDGEYNMVGCKEKGYCYHTHKADHCPLYTDRILYASKVTSDGPDFLELAPKAVFPMLIGCRYEALPHISHADHSPVIAEFSITFGMEASLNDIDD